MGFLLEASESGSRYVLVAELARGGMGAVYAARSPDGTWVAVKTILAEIAEEPTVLDRMLDEARISQRLDHPHVAHLKDFGRAQGQPFLVFELLEGASLAECFDRVHPGGIDPIVAALAIAQAARGIHYAHTLSDARGPLGIVHRDLSPANLFFTLDGKVKVLDFGAATARDRYVRTVTGLVVGNIQFMAPEQIADLPVDARTDLFTLGLVLFEALARRPANLAEDPRRMTRKAADVEIPDLAELNPSAPRPLVAIVRRALAPEPAARFPSAAAMADALEVFALSTLSPEEASERMTSFIAGVAGASVAKRRQELEQLASSSVVEAGEFRWSAPRLNEAAAPATAVTARARPGDELIRQTAVVIRDDAQSKLSRPWIAALFIGVFALAAGVGLGVHWFLAR